MLEGGSVAVTGDDDVTSNREVREMESRIRELERQLGRKTLEVEILKEALDRSRPAAVLPDAYLVRQQGSRLEAY
jgi:predicted RNase H-like nuclease (RuvC/YqgF family)